MARVDASVENEGGAGRNGSAAGKKTALRKRDAAASMSLLQELLYDPLNYGYSKVPQRNGRERPKRSAWGRVVTLVLAVVLGLVVTVSTRSLLAQLNSGDVVNKSLRSQVQMSRQSVNTLQDEVDTLQGKVQILSKQDDSARPADSNSVALAQSQELRGEGVVLTVREDAHADAKGRVQDADLRVLINALWAGGAEGITLGDVRVGPTTSVRTAGGAILVNFRPIEPPYVLQAIGDASDLQAAVTNGDTGTYVAALNREYNISTRIDIKDNLVLPAANNRTVEQARLMKEDLQ